MSDQEVLTRMLTKAGVSWFEDCAGLIIVAADENETRNGLAPGYPGFEVLFNFDAAGALLQIGAWE